MSETTATSQPPPAAHEVITPPLRLDRFVVARGDGGIDFDAIARAEKALDDLSENFADWMADEIQKLEEARLRVAEHGLSEDTLDRLFHTAHDIKGQSKTLGYPLAGDAASSLCDLLQRAPARQRIPLVLIDQHVQAIRAIVREAASKTAEETAARLTHRLAEVTADFIDQEQARVE